MHSKYSFFRIAAILLAILIGTPATTRAEEANLSAYETLANALAATHKDGSFRLRGEETTVNVETADNKTTRSTRYYQINGYDIGARETFVQFENRYPDPQTGALISGPVPTRTSFLITPASILIKTSNPSTGWVKQDLTAMLPKFVSLGAMDIFFLLELLNGDHLPMYEKYVSKGGDTQYAGVDCTRVYVNINRTQFATLADELTKDIKALLGSTADGMNETQLTLMRSLARGLLSGMDAETRFTIYIDKENSRIMRVESKMDMANAYGLRLPGATSRIESSADVVLYDFGKEITRIAP